jgi:hypothetical protein
LRAPGGSIAASATSVEAFCTGCTGLDAQRPAGEIATNLAGDFSLAVRDAGIATAAPDLAVPPTSPSDPRHDAVADLRRVRR